VHDEVQVTEEVGDADDVREAVSAMLVLDVVLLLALDVSVGVSLHDMVDVTVNLGVLVAMPLNVKVDVLVGVTVRVSVHDKRQVAEAVGDADNVTEAVPAKLRVDVLL